jgi:hypothetical protein
MELANHLNDNAHRITSVAQPRGITWILEITDDDALTLTGRVFAWRGAGRGPQPPIVFHRAR